MRFAQKREEYTQPIDFICLHAEHERRLVFHGPRGQIVVSEATLARLGNRFESDEIEPRSLKGKEKPMRRFNVVREKPSAVAKVG
jgi:hypothetical protein